MSEPMQWNGEVLVTYGDIMKVVLLIAERGDRAEAKRFLEVYAKVCTHGLDTATGNIGYMAGYYSGETRRTIHDVFDVSHPIFGRSSPTPQEAFAAGQKLGAAARASVK